MQIEGIDFLKLSAGGNDFILIDDRKDEGIMNTLLPYIPIICKRGMSVGADGMIFITNSTNADLNWVYFNADGSRAPFCINGLISTVYACKFLDIDKKKITLKTPNGLIKTEITGTKIKVFLPPPRNIGLRQEIEIDKRKLSFHYINTGVPHTVIFTESIDSINVLKLGRRIRNDRLFFPQGTNVDFVSVEGKNDISIRTYERGVENETLSCGTGGFASAKVANLLGMLVSPIKVKTRGGGQFIIDTLKNSLEGKARVVYKANLQEALWQK